MSTHAVQMILKKDLKIKRKCAKFIPCELTEPQQWTRMTVSQDNIDLLCSDPDPEDFVRCIVTGDETWISTREKLTKRESTEWVHADALCPRKPLKDFAMRKVMMTVFFDCQGVILIDFLNPREKVTAERYCETLTKLKESLRRKRPNLWRGRNFLLHHDNASPHTAFDTVKKLKQWKIRTLEHPPYSPDLAPCDFALFPKLKAQIR